MISVSLFCFWENFSNGVNSAVFIRELDSRRAPGSHRSCHLVERIYHIDDNGIPYFTGSKKFCPPCSINVPPIKAVCEIE